MQPDERTRKIFVDSINVQFRKITQDKGSGNWYRTVSNYDVNN
jgi:hypothetical protein